MKTASYSKTRCDHAPSCRLRIDDGRRGVLLLVVLSMLTLFLMLGAAYLVTATRARESAKAFARLTFGGDDVRVPHARMLDTVLLRIVRGGSAPTASGAAAPTVSFESLLADKYGAGTVTGTGTRFAAVGGAAAVLTGSVTLGASFQSTDLNGRLITFSAPGRPVTTHRIIRAEGSGGATSNAADTQFTLTIDTPRGAAPFVGPLSSARAVINGREFAGIAPANESWDGFDASNPFLASVQPGSLISTSTVSRLSFTTALAAGTLGPGYDFDGDLIPDAADNDNDGSYDGVFLDYGLPDSTDEFGNTVQLRASVLIVDLDGRFNVNAHDGLARTVYGGTANWPLVSSGTMIFSGSTAIGYSTPIGSGYGPAEINGAFMFVNAPPNAPLIGATNSFSSSAENPTLFAITGGTMMVGTRSGTTGSRYTSGQNTPRLSRLEGKYGEQGPTFPPGWGSISGTTFLPASSGRFPRPGQLSIDDAASRPSDRRVPFTAGNDASVNYGVPSIWWTGSNNFNWAASPTISATTQPLPRGVFNSPPDLHGRMRTITGTTAGIVPQVRFAKVEWANANSGTTSLQESADDPYELRLDTRRGFGGLLFDPTAGGSSSSATSVLRDNPLTPAELEPVLRPYDIDTNRLPPRLAAMLGSAAEESRLKVTTESWDTTAITGSAAVVLFGTAGGGTGWLQSMSGAGVFGTNPISGVIGGEVARGERFDLNRPLAASGTAADTIGYPATAAALLSGTYHLQRQAYFKDLYTLLFALNPTATPATLAQWAANATEFRDGDSRIIPFEYDTNPANGWAPDGHVVSDEAGERKVVWGAERPEIVIREAFAWRNSAAAPSVTGTAGIVISLHRPWNSRAYTGTSGTLTISAEPCDVAFDTFGTGVTPVGTGTALDQVDLGKQAGPTVYSGTGNLTAFNAVTSSTFPIWRLRIVGSSTTILRLDTAIPWAAANEIVVPTVTNGATKPRLPVDSTITILSGTFIAVGPTPTTGTATIVVSGSNRVAPALLPGSANTLTVYLERLSDPSQTLTAAGTVPGTTVTGSTIWMSDPLSAPDTATVPIRYMVVDSATVSVIDTGNNVSVGATSTRRATTSPTTAFWGPGSSSATGATIAANGSIMLPTALTTGSTAWLPWPNRPFVSAAELLLVPQGTALEILQNYQKLTPSLSGAAGLGKGVPVPLVTLLDAVHVPSRFAGVHGSTTNVSALANMGISGTTTPVNQISSFREPGRVNLNTVNAVDVWNAVVAGPLPSPVMTVIAAGFSGTNPAPAKSMFQLLALSSGGSTVVSDTATMVSGASVPQSTAVLAFDRNPLHEIYTATRLANTVTPRSNVFAVWVTLRESVPNDPDSVRYRRAFYIVDRSIPVGFEPGVDHNVWDCVRLRRIVE